MPGSTIKISGFESQAALKSKDNKWIKALVRPQPGHLTSNNVYHMHGIKISTSAKMYNISAIK